jgi:hypothetical protein
MENMARAWHTGIPNRLPIILTLMALIWGLVNAVCAHSVRSEDHVQEPLGVILLKPDHATDHGLFSKLCSILEEVSEKEFESESEYGIASVHCSKLFPSSCGCLRGLSLIFSRNHLTHYRRWHRDKRISIIAAWTARYLFLYHSLKIPS